MGYMLLGLPCLSTAKFDERIVPGMLFFQPAWNSYSKEYTAFFLIGSIGVGKLDLSSFPLGQ